MREVLEETIARGLAATEKLSGTGRVRIRPRAMGLKAVYRQMSLNQVYDQLEAEETAAKRPS
ncbi:hypothetical protein BH20VER1_BH20VER1_01120 [soil metagenome]